MYRKDYSNFVRPECGAESRYQNQKNTLIDGETARRLYLEEVSHTPTSRSRTEHKSETQRTCKRKREVDNEEVSSRKLFTCAENNDVDTMRHILDTYPDKINIVDDYGWSLLMIACQANSIKVVKELLNRGVITTVRDKAGNSAQSLVIKNKNIDLADILLNYKREVTNNDTVQIKFNEPSHKSRNPYTCIICDNKTFDEKEMHLSSTIHNINASKGIKQTTKYIIPESNKGFQLMLKGGWDKVSGLGRDGSGTKYPIKPLLKNDKIGLGHEKNKKKKVKEQLDIKSFKKKVLESDKERNRKLEITLRREFY